MTQQEYQARKTAALSIRDKAQAEADAADACIGEFVRGRTPTQQEVTNEQAKWEALLAEADALA
jgi:hypothetical protein